MTNIFQFKKKKKVLAPNAKLINNWKTRWELHIWAAAAFFLYLFSVWPFLKISAFSVFPAVCFEVLFWYCIATQRNTFKITFMWRADTISLFHSMRNACICGIYQVFFMCRSQPVLYTHHWINGNVSTTTKGDAVEDKCKPSIELIATSQKTDWSYQQED